MSEKEAVASKSPADYYIIDTRTRITRNPDGTNPGRDWKEIDVLANPQYRSMVEDQQLGKLGSKIKIENLPYTIKNRAANFHEMQHLEGTVKYETEKGFIWVQDKADAQRILKALKNLDNEVELSGLGKQF